MATTRNSSANVAATCVHQWAWAPPPCTNTRPRRPGSPQPSVVDRGAVDVDDVVGEGHGERPRNHGGEMGCTDPIVRAGRGAWKNAGRETR